MTLDLSEEELVKLAERTHGFVGADIAGLCAQAAVQAVEDRNSTTKKVTLDHFENALVGIRPSALKELFRDRLE